MRRLLAIFAALAVGVIAIAQELPERIPAGDLPKEDQDCAVCVGHGKEGAVAGVRFRGAVYYFCNVEEVAKFELDPEAFVPPVLPRPAPEIGLADHNGARWDLEALRGRVVIVDFWATWCAPCKRMAPTLKKLRAKHVEQGFEILAVSIDEKASDLEAYLKREKPKHPVLHDTAKVWSAWKVRAVPTYFLVVDGKVVNQWIGLVEFDVLDAAVAEALEQKR